MQNVIKPYFIDFQNQHGQTKKPKGLSFCAYVRLIHVHLLEIPL